MNFLSNKKDIILSIFLPTALAMIFTQVSGVIARIIDGVITSSFLGEEAYSAVSLLAPFTDVIIWLPIFISTGSQVLCSQFTGKGNREEANSVFSLSIILSLTVALILILLCILIPDKLFEICGVSSAEYPELYPHMLSYLQGYMWGIPAMALIQVIGPMIVMDNNKMLFSNSAALLCITDIIGDLLNVYVFDGGVFGMGFASSVAFILQLLYLFTHFIKKNSYFTFSLKSVNLAYLNGIANAGSPTLVFRLAIILRDIFINRINLAIALSTAAIAARGMQADINTLMFCIGQGIGKTMITMTGVYYSVNDLQGLKRLLTCAIRTSILIAGGFGIVVFIFSNYMAEFYTSDPEIIYFAAFSIQCMAVSLVFDSVALAFQNYLQGIQNLKMVYFMNFMDGFFVPIVTAYILGIYFGSMGIMACVAVGKFILILILFAMVCLRKKGFPKSLEDYMFLPKNFGGTKEDNIYSELKTLEDVKNESGRANNFCLQHKVDSKKSELMKMLIEEIAGDIIKNGKSRNNQPVSIEYRLFVYEGRICLTLRDYCQKINPVSHYNESDLTKQVKEIKYFGAFNSNNIIIFLN